jgi:hypothetical protein
LRLVDEKVKAKILLASMKILINFENPFSNPFQRPYSGGFILRMLTGSRQWMLKIFPEAGYVHYVHYVPLRIRSGEAKAKIDQWQRKKACQKF